MKKMLGLFALFFIANTVSATSGLYMTAPSGGDSWVKGQTYKIEWQSTPRADYQTKNVGILLSPYSNSSKVLEINLNNNPGYISGNNVYPGNNTYYLQVPLDFPVGPAKLYVSDKDDQTIYSMPQNGYINISAPVPTITSLNAIEGKPAGSGLFTILWMVSGANGIKLEMPCYAGVKTTEYVGSAQLCGDNGSGNIIKTTSVTNGDMSFLFTNKNTSPVNIQVKLTPVVNGEAIYSSSKLISFNVVPTPQAPVISSINPILAGVGDTIYVKGSNFNQYTYIAFDGTYGQSITPTLISSTELSFVVPQVSFGSHTIQVAEKASGFDLGSPVLLTVAEKRQQSPTISYINPTSGTIGSTVYVYGTNYNSSTFIAIDGSSGQTIRPNIISGTSLSFVIPSNLSIGSHYIQVNEIASSYPLSRPIPFDVVSNTTTNSSIPQTSGSNSVVTPAPIITPVTSTNVLSDTNNVVNACVELSNNLTYRSRDSYTNGDVSALQDFLQSSGYLDSEPTGFFGNLTLKAVKKFQTSNGINPTGYVGSVTRAKIKSLSCQ